MMTTEPILCSGNDLAGVCDDIRARGGVVESLDTGVGGHNAGYRVSYFEARFDNGRVAELADASVAGGDRSRKLPSLAIEGSSPSVLTTFDGGKTIAPNTPSGAEDSAQTNGSEAQRTHLQDCTAVIPVGPGREARAVESAPRTPEMGSNPMPTANYDRVTEEPQSVLGSAQNAGHAGPASVPYLGNHPARPETSPASPAIVISEDRPGGVESADLGRQDDLSIEDRMAALQERLAASGKLGASRFKSTKEARLPHPND